MGYGGALIWTGLVRNIKLQYPNKKIILVYKKTILNYIRNTQNNDLIIYKNNPSIFSVISKYKYYFNFFKYSIHKYEIVFMDNKDYIYCTKDTKEKIYYKTGRHAIEIACDTHNIECSNLKPEICLTNKENEKVDSILAQDNLNSINFICIEPNIKESFTPNKDWGFDRWQELVNLMTEYININNINLEILQIGSGEGRILKNVINVSGKFTFRETARVLQKSSLFISYIGGLTHLSKAVDRNSIVLVSAWEPLELATYPDNINLYSNIECSNCGLKIECPNNIKCMKDILVSDVYEKFKIFIKSGI
jgi:ADP-heptose:LPS heptosyltransferase